MMPAFNLGLVRMREVLELLSDGEFHSGEELGLVLGVSRAAVWKRLQSMEKMLGLQIYSIRGRGYRLASPLSLLDSQSLSYEASCLGWALHIEDVTDSTNAQVLRLLSEGARAPLLLLAERQLSGRGRRGRQWVSPYAENLYYSLGLKLEAGEFPLEGLSLTVGVAVKRALTELSLPVQLKWPNDLLLDGCKVAGILLELAGDPAGAYQVVIGVGVNANMQSVSLPAIDQPWTSLRQALGRIVDRTELAVRLSMHLCECLELHRAGGFAALRVEWEAAHAWQGQLASLQAGVNAVEGEVLGVDDGGALRLRVAGEERLFSGGELSLRLKNDS